MGKPTEAECKGLGGLSRRVEQLRGLDTLHGRQIRVPSKCLDMRQRVRSTPEFYQPPRQLNAGSHCWSSVPNERREMLDRGVAVLTAQGNFRSQP